MEDFGDFDSPSYADHYDGDDFAAYNANEADDYRNEGAEAFDDADENEPTGYETDDFSPLGEEY